MTGQELFDIWRPTMTGDVWSQLSAMEQDAWNQVARHVDSRITQLENALYHWCPEHELLEEE